MVCEKFFNVKLTRRSCLTVVFDTNCLNLPTENSKWEAEVCSNCMKAYWHVKDNNNIK